MKKQNNVADWITVLLILTLSLLADNFLKP